MDYPEMVEDIGTNETYKPDEPLKPNKDMGEYIHSEEYYFDVWRDQQD